MISASITTVLAQNGWWVASRASGLVALVLVTISVGIGLTMAGKLARRRPGLSKKLLAIHEQTALAGLVAIAVHGATLLGDSWLSPSLAEVTVPFAMGYRSLFTGLGVIAAYLAVLLGLSFYSRKRIGPRLWRKAHRATVAVYVLGLVHALGAGSATGTAWFRIWAIATGVPIAVLFLRRAFRRPAAARPPRRSAAPRRQAPRPRPDPTRQRPTQRVRGRETAARARAGRESQAA